jgi:hypothetical protein
MEMKGKGMPGRLKKKPQYNPELQFNDFLEQRAADRPEREK